MSWKDILNQYFDKIYVVTIPRATDRHELVRKQLNGVNFEFFYGADKQQFTLDEAISKGVYSPERTRKENRYFPVLKHGEVACSWSHVKLYQQIISSGFQRVLIFEDDVVVIQQQIDKLESIINELPSDWELLYFGYNKHYEINAKTKLKGLFYKVVGSLRLTPWSARMYSHYYAKPYSEHLMHAGFHDYTHAYAVTLAGAQKLLKFQTPIGFAADTMLAYAIMKEVVSAYISVPILFDQEGSFSYIQTDCR